MRMCICVRVERKREWEGGKGEELAQGHKVERERSGEEEVKLDPGSPEFPPNTFPPLLGIIFLTCLCSLIFWENKAEAKNSFII